MLYYKVLNEKNNAQGYITLNDFRFYHPRRKRFFMTTELRKAQYVIFNGAYYRVEWLAEASELAGQYPLINIVLVEEEEYKKWLKEMELEQK